MSLCKYRNALGVPSMDNSCYHMLNELIFNEFLSV